MIQLKGNGCQIGLKNPKSTEILSLQKAYPKHQNIEIKWKIVFQVSFNQKEACINILITDKIKGISRDE